MKSFIISQLLMLASITSAQTVDMGGGCLMNPSGTVGGTCTDAQLCLINPQAFQHNCERAKLSDQEAQHLNAEKQAIRSSRQIPSSAQLDVEEGKCGDADLSSRPGYINVVPYTRKEIETADPSVPGWNIVGMGAREVEVTRCRYYFVR